MSQQIELYKKLKFHKSQGPAVLADIDTFESASIIYLRPTTDDTGTFAIGDGTKDMDVKIFLGSSSEYALFDVGNSKLDLSTIDVELPATCVDKADLATEVYQELVIPVSFTLDNQTVKLYKCWSACTVVRVAYFTNQACGTNLGIDVVDGGTAGAGTTVIDSCSDNLNGSDVNDLTTPYALSAGDYINVTVDDVTASTFISVMITLKVPLGAAT